MSIVSEWSKIGDRKREKCCKLAQWGRSTLLLLLWYEMKCLGRHWILILKRLQRADGLINKENDTVQLLLIEDTFGIGMEHYSFSSLTHSWRCRPGNDFTWKDLCPKSLIWVHHYILEIYGIRYKKLYYVMSKYLRDFMDHFLCILRRRFWEISCHGIYIGQNEIGFIQAIFWFWMIMKKRC